MLSKAIKTILVAFVAFILVSSVGFAADAETNKAVASARQWGYLAAGIGAGLITIGGAYGIGIIATSAMEGTARQPEAGGMIRVTMIIAAALIEGFTFFALIVTLLLAIAAPIAE